MGTELITIAPGRDIAELFRAHGLDDLLSEIEREARSVIPDITTTKGRSEIASMAAKIARSKTYLDGLGKELTAELKAQTGAVDKERKAMRDRLDALKEEVRKPLTDWQQAEADRVATLRDRIKQLEEPVEGGSAEHVARLEQIEAIDIEKLFQEFQIEAARVKDRQIRTLRAEIIMLRQAEENAAEQERQRQEEAARLQAERDARIAAEAAARATREAEERAKAEAKAEAERVQREWLEQERKIVEAKRKEVEAEKQRIKEVAEADARAEARLIHQKYAEAKMKAAIEAERLRREQDQERRATVLAAAVDDLVAIANNETQRAWFIWTVDQIAAGNVRGLRVEY